MRVEAPTLDECRVLDVQLCTRVFEIQGTRYWEEHFLNWLRVFVALFKHVIEMCDGLVVGQSWMVNPRRACAVRVMVSVCVCVK